MRVFRVLKGPAFWLSTLIIVAVIIGSGLGLYCVGFVLMGFEHPESEFASYKEAVEAGRVGQGYFIPEFIPPSSRGIREIHDIDINECWIKLSFDAGDLETFHDACNEASSIATRFPRASWTRRIGWWPEWLIEGTSKALPLGWTYLECPREIRYEAGPPKPYSMYVAINPDQTVAYIWNHSL